MLSFETTCAFFVASLLMAMTPGPDVIIVLTQSSLYGMRAGVLTTLGLMTGLLGHTLAVALGVAVLFQTSEAAFTALKFLGAAYLLYLAWQSFRSGVFRAFLTQSLFPGYGTLYRRGFLSNITNPKVTLFFLAFLPQFADPARGGLTAQIIALGALFQLATLLVFGCVSLQQFRQGAAVPEPCRRLRFHRAGGHAACLFPLIAPPILPPYTPTAFRKGRYPFRYKDPFHGGPPGNFPVPAKRREASSCCEDCLPP